MESHRRAEEGLKTVEDGRERSRLSKENGDRYYEPDFFACRLSFSRCKTRRYSRRHQAGLTTILHSVTLAANIDGRRLPAAKELGETSLTFQVHPTLSDSDILDTIAAVQKVIGHASC